MFDDLREVWEGIREGADELAKELKAIFEELTENVEEIEVRPLFEGDVYKWQRIQHKQTAADRLKKRSKSRTPYISKWDWRQFRKSRHRGS